MAPTADRRAAQTHDRLTGRAQRAVDDEKKKLAEHWDRFKGMSPEIINPPSLFKGLELHQRLIEMWASVVGQCALRHAAQVFQDEIARAEAVIEVGVTAGMGTHVANACQELHVEACRYFRQEAERIYKALA
ncbi:hypothetical protein AB0D66_22240 [Streptomyces sp. NPDC048270]|uniref:hypothetical protein n=1 Tax=Streptomyces sp. NPDC048270 TaxID=3154615 RepID=UPI00340A79B2